MARRKIATFENESDKAIVYRDPDWNEYRVVFYRDGVKLPDANYYTGDKEDAMSTAQHEVERMRQLTQEAIEERQMKAHVRHQEYLAEVMGWRGEL